MVVLLLELSMTLDGRYAVADPDPYSAVLEEPEPVVDFVSDWLLFLPYSFDVVPVPLSPGAPIVDFATPLFAEL